MRRYQLIPSHAVQTLIITTTSPITSGEVTLPYSFSFNAIGGTPPYTWSETGTLPTGFTLSSGGTLSGTPSATYASSFNVTVTDNIGSHYTASFNLTIVAAVSITTTSPLPNATESSSYSFTMAATGGFTPYTWSLLSSTGSNSWSVSPTGVVTGLPGSVEIDTLDIQVVDALGVPSSANFNLTVNSASGQTFAFYIGPRSGIDTNPQGVAFGSDANVGSLASPWAITSINSKTATYKGQRVGILPGVYNVSALMNSIESPALMLNGGPNSSNITYLGSSNASGTYSARLATLDAMGSTGFYGGSNANNSSVLGQDSAGSQPAPSNFGNWTIDGIIIQGFSYCAVQVGDTAGNVGVSAGVNAQIINCVLQNSNTGNMTGSNPNTAHYSPIEVYGASSLLISNCFLSNNVNTSSGANASHFGGLHIWAFSGEGYETTGVTIQDCTFVKSGGIYGVGDTGTVSGTTVENCFFDMTAAGTGVGVVNNVAIQGLCPSGGTQSQPTFIHHNICRGGVLMDGDQSGYFNQHLSVYNNTFDLANGAGNQPSAVMGIRNATKVGASGLFTVYDNLMYDDGFAGTMQYGYMIGNTTGFALLDYNIYGTRNQFGTFPAGGGDSGGVTAQTFASFKTATGGDVHSSTNSINPFNTSNWTTGPVAGTRALAYQVASGSVAYQTGFVGGTSAGAACNVGAWDGVVTQIGSYFGGVPD